MIAERGTTTAVLPPGSNATTTDTPSSRMSPSASRRPYTTLQPYTTLRPASTCPASRWPGNSLASDRRSRCTSKP